jgi:hypothetical protein
MTDFYFGHEDRQSSRVVAHESTQRCTCAFTKAAVSRFASPRHFPRHVSVTCWHSRLHACAFGVLATATVEGFIWTVQPMMDTRNKHENTSLRMACPFAFGTGNKLDGLRPAGRTHALTCAGQSLGRKCRASEWPSGPRQVQRLVRPSPSRCSSVRLAPIERARSRRCPCLGVYR